MKMWILTFAVLTVYGVISGATDLCESGRPDICFTTNIEPFEFPESIEALDKACPLIISKLSCLVNYKNQCGLQFPGTIDDNLEQIYELASDVCNKDSELHQELANTLPCLGRVVTSYSNSCQPIIEEAVEAVRSRILGDGESTDDPEVGRKSLCLYEALNFACFSAYASIACGDEAKDVMGMIVDRVGYLDTFCHADIREEVKEMMTVMQVEMKAGLEIKNFISKA